MHSSLGMGQRQGQRTPRGLLRLPQVGAQSPWLERKRSFRVQTCFLRALSRASLPPQACGTISAGPELSSAGSSLRQGHPAGSGESETALRVSQIPSSGSRQPRPLPPEALPETCTVGSAQPGRVGWPGPTEAACSAVPLGDEILSCPTPVPGAGRSKEHDSRWSPQQCLGGRGREVGVVTEAWAGLAGKPFSSSPSESMGPRGKQSTAQPWLPVQWLERRPVDQV